MRFRNWLLMGTSVTLLALTPAMAARAQDVKNPEVVAAYQAYAADKSDANKQKLTEACIAAGFKSFDDCVTRMAAALSAPAPAPASSEAPPPPPPSKELAPAPAPSSQAPPPAKPAPAPSSEAAPPPPASSKEAAPAPAPSSPPAPAPAPAAPDISAELAKAVALYNKGAADIGAGNAKRGKQDITKASGEIQALCQQGGFADVQSCLAKFKLTLDPIPEPPAPAAPSSEAPPPSKPAPAPAPSSEAPPPPSKEVAPPSQPAPAPAAPDIAAEITKAVELYNKGAADIGAGNAKRGKQEVSKASGEIEALCQKGGFADVQSCLAKFNLTLDAIPQAPAPAASSSEAPHPAPSSEAPAPASSSAQPAPAPAASSAQPPPAAPSSKPAASSEQAAPVASSAEPAPAPAPNGALKRLTAAVGLYNQGVADLQAGDKAGQAKVDKAKATIDKICTDGGFTDTASCLAQFGLVLNPLPAAPGEPSSSVPPASSSVQPPPAPSSSETPISKLPNASEAVTPSAVEVLPSQVKTTEAAPILDSVKDQQTKTDQGQPSSSSQPPPATPPAPPPTNDKQAQADIPKPAPEQQSTLTDKGKKSKVQDIQVAPPQSTDQVQVKVIQAPPAPTPPPAPPTTASSAAPPPAPTPPQNTGVIIQIGVNIVINNPDQERSRYYDPQEDQIYYEDLSRGRVRETVTRPNGVKLITIRNRHGDILQRSKVLPDGREILLSTYDPNDNDLENWRDPGDDLPPLRLTIPASDYILDAGSADDQEVTDFLDQPPVERVQRIYTIDEVKRSARLRDMVRRLEVGGLTFDTGKATIARSQVGALSKVADAMQKMLDRNPGEVFLIEGHTDAVGSDISNLVLSDQRASTVARILTDFYDIPAENLVTQGYGKRFLKVKTDGPEPLNRRVTIKRITPLISYTADR